MIPQNHQGMMFVVSSPSGAGKTTIIKHILKTVDNVVLSISATTRPPRSGEIDGRDYHFISHERFQSMLEEDAFLEHAQVFGHMYGTPRAPIKEALDQNTDVLFDIDWQGAQQLRRHRSWPMVSVFVLPPSLKKLANRLKTRAKDDAEVQSQRLRGSLKEIPHYKDYDYALINDNLETSVQMTIAILRSERLKVARQVGLSDFVQNLKLESL